MTFGTLAASLPSMHTKMWTRVAMAMVQIPTLARFGDEQKIDEKNLSSCYAIQGGIWVMPVTDVSVPEMKTAWLHVNL